MPHRLMSSLSWLEFATRARSITSFPAITYGLYNLVGVVNIQWTRVRLRVAAKIL